MSKRNYSFVVAGVTVLLACATAVSSAWADVDQSEASVSWDELPKAVMDALANANPTKKFESLTRQEENGFVTYEAEYETESGETEIELSEAGDIMELESELEIESLPVAIADQIEQQFPGAKIDGVSLVRETTYEIELIKASSEIELSFYADGSEFANDAGDLSNRGGFDEVLDWEDVPTAVQETLAAFLLVGAFESIERDEKNGLVSYKAMLVGESGESQIRLTEAGDMLEIRKSIQAESLPVAVAGQTRQRFPDAAIEDATEFQETYYEIALTTKSDEMEVAYFADGTVADVD